MELTAFSPRRLFTRLIVVVTMCASALAQDREQTFADVFPKGCIAYASVRDFPALKSSFDGSPFGRFFADPGFKATFEALTRKWEEQADSEAEKVLSKLRDSLDLIQGEIAVALLEVDKDSETPDFAAALLINVGDKTDEFARIVEELFDEIVKEGKAILKHDDLDGVPMIRMLEKPEEGEEVDDQEVQFAASNGVACLVVAAGSAAQDNHLGRLLRQAADQEGESLRQDPAFTETALATCVAQVEMYLHVGTLAQLGRDQMEAEPEDGEVLEPGSEDPGPEGFNPEEAFNPEAMGLLSFGAVTFQGGLDLSGGSVSAELKWSEVKPLQQILSALFSGSDTVSFASWVPADAKSFTSIAADLKALLDLSLSFSKTEESGIPPPVSEAFKILNGQLAFFVSSVPPEEGLPIPQMPEPLNFALFLGVHDSKAADAFVTEMLRPMGLHAARRREEFLGFQVYHLPVGGFINVHYAVLEECVLASLSDTLIKDVLRRKSNPELESLLGSGNVKTAIERLQSGSTSFTYSESRMAMLQFVLQLAQGIKEIPGLEEGQIELPPLETLKEIVNKYFNGAIVGVQRVDEKGLRLRGQWQEPVAVTQDDE